MSVWVTANFKETDLEGVHVGAKAYVDVDAISHESFVGEVEAIQFRDGFDRFHAAAARQCHRKFHQSGVQRSSGQNQTDGSCSRPNRAAACRTFCLREGEEALMEERKPNPLIVFVAVLASLLEIIDTSIVNVSLPTMMGNLGATLEDISMVITGYAIANAVVLAGFGTGLGVPDKDSGGGRIFWDAFSFLPRRRWPVD